jgi:hypothetical protein
MQLLLKKGGLRVGTLFDYRNRGKYGEMSSDKNEGRTEITGNIIFYDYKHISSILVKSSVNTTGKGENQLRHFKNETLYTDNLYTFSAASAYTEEDHKKWYEKEGYDACYLIHSARLFFRAISMEIDIGNFVCFGPIHYFDETKSNQIFEGHFHPALIKNRVFGSQFEVRALWSPKLSSTEIDPIIIKNSNANKYCSPFRVIQAGKFVSDMNLQNS